jgi:hypothetical protein
VEPETDNQRPDRGEAIAVVTYLRGKPTEIDRQEAACRELAKRLDWSVTHVLNEGERSTVAQRPQYERLLALIEADEVDALVAFHVDRLVRREDAFEPLIDLASDHEVDVHTVVGVNMLTPARCCRRHDASDHRPGRSPPTVDPGAPAVAVLFTARRCRRGPRPAPTRSSGPGSRRAITVVLSRMGVTASRSRPAR